MPLRIIFIKYKPNYIMFLLKTSRTPQCPHNKIDTKYSRPFVLLQITHTESLFIKQPPSSISPLFPSCSIHSQIIIIPSTWNIHFYLYNFESPKLCGFLAYQTFINGLINTYILSYNIAVTFFRKLILQCSSTLPLPTTSSDIIIAWEFLCESPNYAIL